jgi:hypothetical protein
LSFIAFLRAAEAAKLRKPSYDGALCAAHAQSDKSARIHLFVAALFCRRNAATAGCRSSKDSDVKHARKKRLLRCKGSGGTARPQNPRPFVR